MSFKLLKSIELFGFVSLICLFFIVMFKAKNLPVNENGETLKHKSAFHKQ